MLSPTQPWIISNQQAAVSLEELTLRYDHEAAAWQTTIERLRQPEAYRQLFADVHTQNLLPHTSHQPAVLDCGIGTGALSEALTPYMPEQTTYSGIDISAGMLLEARRRLQTAGVSFTLSQQSATSLQHTSASFDIVMSAHMLEHLPNPQEGLNEMLRVLKPGGLLLLIMTRRTPFGAWIRRKWGVHQLRPQQLAGWLGEAGLRQVRPFGVGHWWCVNHWLSVACVGVKNGE